MTRCAVYIRVSTEEQAIHGYSLEAQKAALTEYAKAHSLDIVDYYIDEGLSARKKMAKRKEFQRMLSDVIGNRIDLILITKLDRWFRNISDYYKVQEILETYHVNWKTIYENYDTTSANGRLHINIMLSVAQDEADRTSERIKVVFQNKKNKGEVTNGSHPLGFKIENKRLIPDDKAIDIVREIFNYYELHQSIYETTQMVRDKYKLTFCNTTISRILKNKIYTEYRDDTITAPLIDLKQFNQVQTILPIPKRRRNKERVYLFGGLLICRECGRKLTGNHSTVTYKNSIKEYYIYRCKRYSEQRSCSHKKSLNETKLENYLINQINQILTGYQFTADINETKKYTTTNEINKLQLKLEKLKELYMENLIDIKTYKEDHALINTQLKNLHKVEKRNGTEEFNSLLNTDFDYIYSLLSRTEKRILWRSLIATIQVDGNNQFVVNYK
ncbi:recombinase family protein [Anaerocolumna sp. MB42-C2]|uniref:recombinase family protein n=1 Tax=Anaerocolumna sp. MB42-C2 TaxID=3070997 RepID=UPI0027E0F763|nr:recombinase family protein [Anaerocolumna sp. MB42-C2]WMJ87580.1 recombinase family protein [Anaerocolumna sp. MB42-C2]